MMTYKCLICQEEKIESDFYTWEKDGYRQKTCKNCRKSINSLEHQKVKIKRPKSLFIYRARARAKKLGIPFDLDESDIIIPELCPILGIRLILGTGFETTGRDNSPSLDRVIPDLGYVKGNVRIISKKANTIKGFGTIEEHKKVIEYMEKFIIKR